MSKAATTPRSRKARAIRLSDALEVLRAHRNQLEALGVVHAGVFGSVARGEARPTSDLDVLVDLDDEKIRSIYDYCGVRLAISDLFDGRADVVERQSLKPGLKANIVSEVVLAF